MCELRGYQREHHGPPPGTVPRMPARARTTTATRDRADDQLLAAAITDADAATFRRAVAESR